MAEPVREKIFEHFLEFPEDVRMVVINEMEPEDRCRFTRSSSLCQKEARKCKNYIYGLKFDVITADYITLDAFFTEKYLGNYSVQFSLYNNGNKFMSYTTISGRELWRTQLDSSTDLMQYACENAKSMIQMYQNVIKKLALRNTGNYDFGIRSLNNLERLKLIDQADIQKFISKIRKPLKELECYLPISKEMLEDFEQILHVQDVFEASKIDITFKQFEKLCARRININIGILTEENISDFIQSWQNDKLRKSFQYCQWSIYNTAFNVQKLLRLLGIYQNAYGSRWKTIEIQHNTDATKTAEIGFNTYELKIQVFNQ